MEVLAAIFMEDFRPRGLQSKSPRPSSTTSRRRRGGASWSSGTRSAPYPEGPSGEIERGRPGRQVVLEMTRVSVAFAEELKGGQ